MAISLEDISAARTTSQSAATTAGQSGSEQYKVEDVLRQKIIDAYGASQDIVKPLDVATKNYLGAPQAGREKYQDIFNPFQRENLVSQYVGTESLPMLSLSSILGQRFGRIEDTIGAGTRAFQSKVAADQSRAQTTRQSYQDLLGEYEMQQPKYDWLDLGNRQVMLDAQGNIVQSYAKGKLPGTGDGGGGGFDLSSLLPGGGSPTPQSFDEPPYSSPLNQSTQVEWPSGSGVWWMGDGQGGWN